MDEKEKQRLEEKIVEVFESFDDLGKAWPNDIAAAILALSDIEEVLDLWGKRDRLVELDEDQSLPDRPIAERRMGKAYVERGRYKVGQNDMFTDGFRRIVRLRHEQA